MIRTLLTTDISSPDQDSYINVKRGVLAGLSIINYSYYNCIWSFNKYEHLYRKSGYYQ